MDIELERVLDDFMRRKNLRSTSQRRCLLSAIFSTKEHFTTDQLFVRLAGFSCKASRSTVYRTLGLLVEAGLLKEIHLSGEQVHYDPNFSEKPDHAHIICTQCGCVQEVDDSSLVKKVDAVSKKYGFSVQNRFIKIEGICESCRNLPPGEMPAEPCSCGCGGRCSGE